jgi:hypothetical protein
MQARAKIRRIRGVYHALPEPLHGHEIQLSISPIDR